MSYIHPEVGACPSCGKKIDRSSAARPSGRQVPREGDLSVCIACGTVLTFGAGMALERLSAEEWLRLPEEARREIRRVQAALVRVTALWKSRN